MTDVSKQDHYEIRNPQPIDVAIAWDLDYLEGNVLKYLGRWRFKNGVEDLEKMVDYAKRLLQRELAKAIQDGKVSSDTLIAQDTNGMRIDPRGQHIKRWLEQPWPSRRD